LHKNEVEIFLHLTIDFSIIFMGKEVLDLERNYVYNVAKGGEHMPSIRPISDLRNHFAEITRDVQSSKEPVFLTKNGVGALVVMSMECYEERQYESEVYNKLREAEIQAGETSERLSHEEVMKRARQRLQAMEKDRA